MDNQLIKNKLIAVIEQNRPLVYNHIEIVDVKDLISELGLDSIMIMQLLIDIESCFDIQFDNNFDYEDIQSFEKLHSFVVKRIYEKV